MSQSEEEYGADIEITHISEGLLKRRWDNKARQKSELTKSKKIKKELFENELIRNTQEIIDVDETSYENDSSAEERWQELHSLKIAEEKRLLKKALKLNKIIVANVQKAEKWQDGPYSLKVAEQEQLVRAAEEKYKKAVAKRNEAEEDKKVDKKQEELHSLKIAKQKRLWWKTEEKYLKAVIEMIEGEKVLHNNT